MKVTDETTSDILGPVVHRSENYVIRALECDGAIAVYIHRIYGDDEQLPKGYVLGLNYATIEP